MDNKEMDRIKEATVPTNSTPHQRPKQEQNPHSTKTASKQKPPLRDISIDDEDPHKFELILSATMATTVTGNPLRSDGAFNSDSESDGQARGGRRALTTVPQLPSSSGLSQPAGQMLRGATDDEGKPTKAALLVGIKLDLEAEVHLTARVRGDICIGLY